MKKCRINPFFALYLVAVFLPVMGVATTMTAVLTIIFSFFGDKRWTYFPAMIWARLACLLAFIRVKINGKNNYSAEKSYIFISNHQSIYDVFVIYGWLQSRFKWIMKMSLRKIPLVGLACEKAGHIFIDRSSPIKAQKSIKNAEEKLKNGASLVIFPEGSRTKNGSVGRFKRGAFKIADDLKLPIVPITIDGAYEVMPYGSVYIKPHKINVTIHQPIDCKELTDENMQEYIEKTRNEIIKSFTS
ncbi:MAG: 1-acyl-sn-glycerol-3-phosphate acyltransferase [Prevotellaceae bacterium]|jgi:1-acyl-sn-glycerol-3-phosphate acyltransferase|nr:1-acyl-sn-glycerol-3-phosphate acyltransferase [Prevotellaceae bacterium]